MNRRFPGLAALLLAATAALPLAAQPGASGLPARPIPHPVTPSREFAAAVARGTRTETGAPGPRYWQQWSRYRIRATVDPDGKTLSGSETVVYHNRSPDTLNVLVMKVWQNLHAPGVPRNEEAEITGGMRISRLALDGQTLAEGGGRVPVAYQVSGTNLAIRPARPLLPGDSARIEVDFSYTIPQAGGGARMGYGGGNMLYLAYWYPQMAVYDDVGGWHTDPFLGNAEFYMGYGDYEYTVDAPEGWVVMGTGRLLNPEAVLPRPVLDRWRRAQNSDTVVHVLTAADFGPGKATVDSPNGRLQWSFRADTVRDVAFGATRESFWDAARTPVGDRDGDRRPDYTLVQSFWRASAPRWAKSVEYGQQSIRFLSEYLGLPYPYPHMTAVEGQEISGGGMEYPMMTLIGSYSNAASDTSLYSVTAHELAHMWVPMIVGVDETRHGWMDEGTTNFNENQAFDDTFRTRTSAHLREQRQYLAFVRGGNDTELLTWTDYQHPDVVGFASYTKPAAMLNTLRGLIGEEAFNRGLRTYMASWKWKHPQPWDFFHAFNTAAGRDLTWFWSSWYAEAWTLDQAVARVESGPSNSATVTIEDRGLAPMPARIVATRQDGSAVRLEVPVETWLRGERRATVTVPAGASPVVRVEIDPEQAFPDVDRANNVWTGR
ncbi:MAG TPA: M1 family metallopeptidase [Longimicrobium sp.]|nr:M1 family metallopeptidase [Longimicrobium sp.]